jgi:hypothetical protein
VQLVQSSLFIRHDFVKHNLNRSKTTVPLLLGVRSSCSCTVKDLLLKRPSVAFHCYGGSYQDQAAFTSQFPDKEVYFTGTSWVLFMFR